MQQSFEPPTLKSETKPSTASTDTRELVSRLSFEHAGIDDSTIKAVAEATGKSTDSVRSELQIMRLEKRVAELESAPPPTTTVDFAGKRNGGFFYFIHILRESGFAGQIILVCLGICMILFTIFLGVAMASGK